MSVLNLKPVVLKHPHTHEGQLLIVGSKLDVPPQLAEWLIEQGVADDISHKPAAPIVPAKPDTRI